MSKNPPRCKAERDLMSCLDNARIEPVLHEWLRGRVKKYAARIWRAGVARGRREGVMQALEAIKVVEQYGKVISIRGNQLGVWRPIGAQLRQIQDSLKETLE